MDEAVFGASFGQQRLWFLEQLDPGTAAYNLPRVFQIKGTLKLPALSQALQAIVARQESLRTVFRLADGQPKQVILPSVEIHLPVADLSALSETGRDAAARKAAADTARKPFNLESGPLLRALLIRFQPDEHVLVLVIHHLITDGWSMSVMFREIGEFYASCLAGREPQLPSLPIQYSDFSEWQRETFSRDFLATRRQYWQEKVRGAETILQLLSDFRRPPVRSGNGRTIHLDLEQGIAEKLNALSRSQGATLFMTLLAAFHALLWRYTSQDSILVGTPIASRTQMEFENIIGFFVNTLILRADFRGGLTFRELLKQIRDNALEAYTNQDMPFEKLVEELQPERGITRSPLFQVMFVFQNTPKQLLELSGLQVKELEFDCGTAKFDLTLEIIESNGLRCSFEYDADLYRDETIRRMAGHFEQLIRSFLADPDQPLSRLRILTGPERKQFQEWNDTAAGYATDVCIHTAFEQQVERTPDAVAFLTETSELTYRQLNDRANRLAHQLMNAGVEPGALVGIAIERSLELPIGLLGILKAGAAYVPFDLSYPKSRLAFLLEDSQVGVIVTRRRNEEFVQGKAVKVVPVETDFAAGDGRTSANPSVPLCSQGRAYVIYTSGSTGVPKGVEGTHRASMNRFSWMWNSYPFSASETCCQKTALSFVDSIWEIFGPLLRGVPNVIIPDHVVIDPAQLIPFLAKYRVTRIVLVPSLLRVLLNHANDLAAKLPDLKLWSCSGEVLPPDLAKRFQLALPNAKLLNIYGSSEVAADVAWHEVAPDSDGAAIPLGRPIQNCQMHVLDSSLNQVPVGARGEICVGGDCLALGYLRRPELTSERFVANPFESGDSNRLYKTGDLGRYLPHGDIEFLGRADNQVKISGMRIELGEIEAALASHPQIREAVVTLKDESADRPQLVAYLVVRDGASPMASELRRFLYSALPDYMIPSEFLLLDAFPLLPSGKVNRKGLSSAPAARVVAQHVVVAPRTPTEEKLLQIWREVLSTEGFGVEDNFFELGGHSLAVIQVTSRIRNIFEVEVPFRSLFEEPTISALAREVEKARATGRKAPAPILPRRKDPAPNS